MTDEKDICENGLFIVTGSNVPAEQCDRPLAYQLKNTIEQKYADLAQAFSIVVLSDLWYLNTEPYHQLPTISIGRPGVNALAAHLLKRLPHILAIDNALLIQLDPTYTDLRTSIWGMDHSLTINALDLFVNKGYLGRFLETAALRIKD